MLIDDYRLPSENEASANKTKSYFFLTLRNGYLIKIIIMLQKTVVLIAILRELKELLQNMLA